MQGKLHYFNRCVPIFWTRKLTGTIGILKLRFVEWYPCPPHLAERPLHVAACH